MTVNVTCHLCDGRRLCDACRTAARTLAAAGYRTEHSTRYAALRAAATGSYGFDACVVPVDSGERAVIDAAVELLAGKRLALVVDDPGQVPASASSAGAVLARTDYVNGDFSLAWLTGEHRKPARAADDTATVAVDIVQTAAADRAQATRRLKRLADGARAEVARADLGAVPRLDMLAVLDDEVAWARTSGTAFAIVLVHLHGISSSKTSESTNASEKRVRDAEHLIARSVRSSDIVSGRGDDFLVVLADASRAGLDLAAARIAAAVAASHLQHAVARTRRTRGFAAWSVGQASYPDDGATRDTLIAHATATLKPIPS